MSFAWTKKVKEIQLSLVKQDKISLIEHKNGKCLVSSCKEDDAFGIWKEEGDGQEVVLPCIKNGEGELQEGKETRWRRR
jgi:hypothetical protein